MNFLFQEEIVHHSKQSNVYWFKKNNKFFRCKGGQKIENGRFLITYQNAEEMKYISNSHKPSAIKARELGIPVLHTRKIVKMKKFGLCLSDIMKDQRGVIL